LKAGDPGIHRDPSIHGDFSKTCEARESSEYMKTREMKGSRQSAMSSGWRNRAGEPVCAGPLVFAFLMLVPGTGGNGVTSGQLAAQETPSVQEGVPSDPSEYDGYVHEPLFRTADRCMSCHNNVVGPNGEDLSIGFDWRGSMMANSSRDPYWQAAVRREVLDHPSASEAIQNECAKCHMPMASYEARVTGDELGVFTHLPADPATSRADSLAADGVSCTLCHQIQPDNLGTEESMVGGFQIDSTTAWGQRHLFGPFQVDSGRVTIMHSSAQFEPREGDHIQSSELCATCHTLRTHALGPEGDVIGELPEQVPYQEWEHSAYAGEQSCQSCHMPVVEDSIAVTGVLGVERAEVSRHVFRGGNFFMLRMLNRYRNELGVEARPEELTSNIRQTEEHLRTRSARLEIADSRLEAGRLDLQLSVENLAGHKLPTAYPSRRAWVHLTVRDTEGDVVFESGRLEPSGRIVGNDNDEDPARFEPHHERIESEDQVQIYEVIMVGPDDEVTTGLLTGVRYTKDNRLLPTGFDKSTAPAEIGVHGEAETDLDFEDGSDRITYSVDVAGVDGPLTVEAELWYQPIGYRWARNLADYDAFETRRFVRYFESMSDVSGLALARAGEVVEEQQAR